MLSTKFIHAIKVTSQRHYRIAQIANIHPSLLSKWINGIEKVPFNDPRIIKVGEVIGLKPHEVFENNEAKK